MGLLIHRLEVFNQEIVPELPLIVAKSDQFKFLLASCGEDKGTLVLSPIRGPNHSRLLPKGADLVGAGLIKHVEGRVIQCERCFVVTRGDALLGQWGSDSCFDEYGHDRPADRYEADRLLRDICVEVNQWIDRTLSESK